MDRNADSTLSVSSGSTDATAEMCRDMAAHVYYQEGWESFGKARQKAVAYASNTFDLMFTSRSCDSSRLSE